jgi:hypothetical protein
LAHIGIGRQRVIVQDSPWQLAPYVGIYDDATSHNPEAAASSCRSPQKIRFWFELTITVLVKQAEGLLSLTNVKMTINPNDERVILIIARHGVDVSWPSNFEMRWGIWLGEDKICFGGRQKTTVISEQAGCGVDGGSLQVGSDQ